MLHAPLLRLNWHVIIKKGKQDDKSASGCHFTLTFKDCTAMQMAQIELEQCEEYIKQLQEQSQQDQVRIDNKVLAACPASACRIASQEQNRPFLPHWHAYMSIIPACLFKLPFNKLYFPLFW